MKTFIDNPEMQRIMDAEFIPAATPCMDLQYQATPWIYNTRSHFRMRSRIVVFRALAWLALYASFRLSFFS